MFRKQLFLTVLLLFVFTIIVHAQAGNKSSPGDRSSMVLNSKPISAKEIDEWRTKVDKNLATYRKATKNIFGQSAEGGVVIGYFDGTLLLKISAMFFGETGRAVTEYYLQDGRLCFVLREEQLYDKPISKGEPKTVEKKQSKLYIMKGKILQWIGENGKLVKDDGENYAAEIKHLLNDIEEYQHLIKSQKPRGSREPRGTPLKY